MLREFFHRRTRDRAGGVGNARLLRRRGQIFFRARPHDARQAHRRDTDRRGVALAEQHGLHVERALVDAVTRHQFDRIERGGVARDAAIAAGAAVGGVKAEFRNPRARVFAHVMTASEICAAAWPAAPSRAPACSSATALTRRHNFCAVIHQFLSLGRRQPIRNG